MGNTENRMRFPVLRTETLSGTMLELPRDITKKATVIAIAFERGVQEQIDAWTDIISKLNTENSSDIDIYEIPMLKGRWKLLSGIIDGGMRSGIDERKHPFVATYYGDISQYKRKLEIKDESVCHFFILDSGGYITFSAAGSPNSGLAEKALSTIRQLLR